MLLFKSIYRKMKRVEKHWNKCTFMVRYGPKDLPKSYCKIVFIDWTIPPNYVKGIFLSLGNFKIYNRSNGLGYFCNYICLVTSRLCDKSCFPFSKKELSKGKLCGMENFLIPRYICMSDLTEFNPYEISWFSYFRFLYEYVYTIPANLNIYKWPSTRKQIQQINYFNLGMSIILT